MQSLSQSKRTASLPPEIWICIFHHATDVPGTLIPDIYAHASLIGPVYNERSHTDLRRVLITKRTLVRVCRQWWHLAMPFLYHSVYIDQTCCLSSLSRTLADSATGKGTVVSTRPLGGYTQRLDIAIRDDSMDADAESGYLTTIIKHMPRLSIVMFAPTTWYTDRTDPVDNIVDALQQCAGSLRVLDWSAPRLQPSNCRFMNLLAECTQLRILHYSYSILSEIEYDSIPATVTTLRVRCIHPDQTHNRLPQHSGLDVAHCPGYPALRELILDIYPHYTQGLDFLRAYGSQLDSVHFYVIQMHSIGPPLRLLAQTSPGLRRLTITSEFNFGPIRIHFALPSVTYLGLNITWFRSTNRKFERFFMVLEQLAWNMPSLRVVRLVNERHVNSLLIFHTELAVRALQPLMVDPPFRIEDWDGVLLTDRLRALGHL